MSILPCIHIAGDSISGCTGTWPLIMIGATQRGSCSVAEAQAAAVYSGTIGGTPVLLQNWGIAGGRLGVPTPTVADVNYILPNFIAPILSAPRTIPGGPVQPVRKCIYLWAGGTNDQAKGPYLSAAPYAADAATSCRAAKSAGADLVGMTTLIPRDDATMTEPNRGDYNTLVLDAAWRLANGIDFVVDFASDPIMGLLASCSNPLYFLNDKIHPTTPVGQTRLAAIGTSTFSTVIASLGG